MIFKKSITSLTLILFIMITTTIKAQETVTPTTPGTRVIATAFKMAFTNKEIIKGSCWDFVNAVYNRAGYNEKARTTLFKSSLKGPYADTDLIIPGDWIAHINTEYGNVEHSAIFVRWIDKANKVAETIDYAGMNREEPGRMRDHQLTMVFMIIRPKIVKTSAVK